MTVITHMPMYRVIVLKSAIGLYLKSNRRLTPNRAYTPTNMLKWAGEITGKRYKRGQHQQALLDLGMWLEVARLKGETLQDERPL